MEDKRLLFTTEILHGYLKVINIIVLIVAVALAGFHLNYPIIYMIFGRAAEDIVSLEFFSCAIVAVIGLISFFYFLLRQKKVSISFTFFVFWSVFSSFFNSVSIRNLLSPISLLLIMSGAYYIFKKYGYLIQVKLPLILFSNTILLDLYLFYCFFIGDYNLASRTSYAGSSSAQSIYQLRIGGLLSTEITLFLGSQLVYIIYFWRVKFNRYIIIPFLLLNLTIFYYTGSSGAIIGMLIIVALHINKQSVTRKNILLFILMCVFSCIFFYSFINENIIKPYYSSIEYKADLAREGKYGRNLLYEDLWRLAKENPLIGIGLGQFEKIEMGGHVPHQNLLGRACENGFPAMFLYIFFLIFTFLSLIKAKKIVMHNSITYLELANSAYFIEACFIILVYLQFRGLFTDTWTLKEQYFLVGAALGIGDWAKIWIMEKNHKSDALMLNKEK